MIITLAGIDLSVTASEGWVVEGLSEWFDLPGSRSDAPNRPRADGAYAPSETYRDALRPALSLHWKGRSAQEAVLALRALRALVHRGLVPLTVDDGFGPLTRIVEVANVQVSPRFDWWHMPVAIDVIAHDPLAYGQTVQLETGLPSPSSGLVFPITYPLSFGTPGSDGRVSLTNTGTAPARTSFTARGGFDGFEITEVETGRRLRLERQVLDGSSVDLDGRTRRVVIDDQSDLALVVDEWPSIPPGETHSYQFTALGVVSGEPTLSARFEPAFA